MLDVGDIDGGGKLALEAAAIDPAGIVYGSLRNGFGCGVEEGDGIGCVLIVTVVDAISGPVIIFSEIAGAVLELGHVSAVGRELERDGVAIVCRASIQSLNHGLTIARLTGPALIYRPAGQGAAGDDAPRIAVGWNARADVVQTAHDDGEERAAGGKMGLAVFVDQRFAVLIGDCGFRLVIGAVRVDELDAFAGGDSALETGVCTGGPAVLHIIEKDRYRVVARQHEIDVLVAAIAFAALWPLLQDQVFNVMLVCQLVEADVSAGVVVEDEAAAAVGRAGGQKAIFIVALGRVDSVSVGFFILCGGVEVKLDAGQALAELVDLDAVGLGDVGEVKLHREVRIRAAALEIEELQRVIGVVGEGLAAPGFGVGAVAIDRVFQVSSKDIVDVDIAVGKIDFRGGLIVDAAEVGHKDAVDEDPDVIVTGKFEGHGFAARLGSHAAVALDEARGHGDAEEMVDTVRVRVGIRIRRQVAVVVYSEDVCGGGIGKGEELASLLAVTNLLDAPGVIDLEGLGTFIEIGIVGRLIASANGLTLVVVGVIVVIAVVVDPQEAADIPIGFLADGTGGRAAVGRGVDLLGLIKEIGQRLLLCGIHKPFAALLAGGQNGIAAGKAVLHDAGKRGLGAGPLVDIRTGTAPIRAIAVEFQVMVLVDALIMDVAIWRFGIIGGPGIDPVVKQVDLDACGRDSVLDDVVFQLLRCGCGSQSGREQRHKNGQCAEQAERADRIMMLHKITSPDVPMVRRNIDLDFTYILHLRGEKRKEICIF